MKRSVRYLTGIVALFASSGAFAKDLPNYSAYYDAKPRAASLAPAAQSAIGGQIASMDERRGVPSFFWTPPQPLSTSLRAALRTPEQAARFHLKRFSSIYGVSDAALSTAVVTKVHDLGQGGIVVTMRQELNDVELFHGEVKVMLRQNLEAVAISGSLHPSVIPGMKMKKSKGTWSLSAQKALAAALSDRYGSKFSATSFVDTRNIIARSQLLDLLPTPEIKAKSLHFSTPARVKRVYFPLPDRVVPAYYVEFLAGDERSTSATGYSYVIAADDGRVLYRVNLKHSDTFNYRVWADPAPPAGDGRPFDGPIANFTPHPTGLPDNTYPAFDTAPSLIAIDGFNKNPAGVGDPWLPAGATETHGNNVDAYTDILAPDGFSAGDFRANVTSPGTFDRVYNLSLDPLASQEQGKAATTQIFYTTNWLHDWWYDSGFNEQAGNAQQDNFGRGGVAGDPLHAEAEDDANNESNNANMNAMSDGISPVMQMYVWDGKGENSVTIQPSNTSFLSILAGFGPASANVTADLVLAVDGTAPPNDGCETITNSLTGKVALIDRGACNFTVKVQNAQNAGAVAVIIADNVPGFSPPPMGGTSTTITIPTVSVTQASGNALKAALMAGAVTAKVVSLPGEARADGTIDNTVVAHEWGHYLHLRQVACFGQACGAESEGWGDYNALQMVVRSGDNLDGVFPLAIYAEVSPPFSGYFGIRRVPYTTDFTKNALTFRHISDGELLPTTHPVNGGGDNSEVHNAGEIWATMLWEAHVALLKTSQGPNPVRSFDEARRLMSNYIEGGLQLAPVDPSYTQQRDAILAAAAANSEDDFLLLAQAFAKRGAGTCAVSPPAGSLDLVGVVESFTLSPEVKLLEVKVDDSIKSCDTDGLLDAGEIGKVTIKVQNTGMAPMTTATATLSSMVAGVSFPNGATVAFPPADRFATSTATVDIALANTFTGVGTLALNVALNDPAACTVNQSKTVFRQLNSDSAPNSSASDDVESDATPWTPASVGGPPDIWSREFAEASNTTLWHGIDFPSTSDSTLESPVLNVSPTDNFVISFTHRYSFEASFGINWDGGVIEVSTDDGASWSDITSFGAPNYTGQITDIDTNPLFLRDGYVATNAAFPATEPESINLGNTLAGQSVKVRFRVGSDSLGGDIGWEIDNISFQGITNKPFPTIKANALSCNQAPIANAGPDQTVESGALVTLDGSKSADPDGDPITFVWTEQAGTPVTLDNATAATTTFNAPTVTTETLLTFQIAVSDGRASGTDSVDIKVLPPATGASSSATSSGNGASSSSGGGGGGGGGGGASSSSSSASSSSATSSASSSGSGSSSSSSGSGNGSSSSSGSGNGSSSGSGNGSSSSGGGGGGSGGAGQGGEGGEGGASPAGGGCACSTVGGELPEQGAPLVAFAALALLRRRRRNPS